MRALIASSATGGHIYPALAVAEEIKRRDPAAEILFIGARWEIGKDIVGSAGYRQEFIDAEGFDRKNPLKNFAVLAGIVKSSGEIKKILKEFKPDVCVGTGGHVSGPVIRVAKKCGIRTILMEQNVIPGMANIMAEKYSDRIFVAFDDTVERFKDPGRVTVSGNPVRTAFAAAAKQRGRLREKYRVPEGTFCVLVFGGSQGADAMNDAGVSLIEGLAGKDGFFVILITGRQLFGPVEKRLQGSDAGSFSLLDYSDEIYDIFAASDLIVSRAGALTVTEIAHSGKASVLIPSPNVTNNHQYYNAKVLADAGAAVLLTEEELGSGVLTEVVKELAADPGRADEMGRKAAGMAKKDAAGVIADEIFRI